MQQFRKNLGKVSLTAEGVWDIKSKYNVLSIVYDEHTQHGFISKQPVPIGVDLYNSEYWMPLNVSGYTDSNIIILNNKTSDASIETYTLEEAIKSINFVGRKPGCILGFYNSNANRLDIGGCWEIWQFNSTTISEWEDLSNWKNIYYNYNQFVGWYRNEEQLKINNPYPEVGCYAYVGNILNEAVVYRCEIKHKWTETVQRAWDYVKIMIDGTVTVGENGNWYNNGEDTGIPANVKGDPGISPFIRYNTSANKLEYSYDKIKWIKCSDYIFTWFRWQATAGDTQANNVGRIQMSRDNGKTWTNMSNDFTNNLHISRYIGVNESLPTSSIAEGTIYAKGPYYAEDDASNNNPIYRLWVYAWKDNTLAWQDNGEFTSIAAGVVQETGDSETEVMSQKAVSEKLSKLESEVDEIIVKTVSNYNGWAIFNFPIKSSKIFTFTILDKGCTSVYLGEDPYPLYDALSPNTPVSIRPNKDYDYIKCWVGEGVEITAAYKESDSIIKRLSDIENDVAKSIPIVVSSYLDYNNSARLPYKVKKGKTFNITLLNQPALSVALGEDGNNLFGGGLDVNYPINITPDRDADYIKCYVNSPNSMLMAQIIEEDSLYDKVGKIEKTLDDLYNVNGKKSAAKADYNGWARVPFNVQTGVPFVLTLLNTNVTSVVLGENGENLFPGGLEINYPVIINPNVDAEFVKVWVGVEGKMVEAKFEPTTSLNQRTIDNYIETVVSITNYNNNLKTLFESIKPTSQNHYTVLIPEGEYDVKSWFEPIPVGDVGLKLPSYVKLKGVGRRDKIVIKYDNSNGIYNNDVSTLNTTGAWHELENLTVVGINVRYAVHDDSHYGGNRYVHCKNCRFISTIGTRAWGAGTNTEYKGVFENCIFEVLGEKQFIDYYDAIVIHDYESSANTISDVLFRNCRFNNQVPINENGYTSSDVSIGFVSGYCNVTLEGCKVGKEGLTITNKCMATGFANVFEGELRVIDAEEGVVYFDFI